MASAVYLLCAATSFVCAFLLLRGWSRSRVSLLFWVGLCFGALVLENLVLFADFVLFPSVDLSLLRHALGLIGPAALVFSLVAESE